MHDYKLKLVQQLMKHTKEKMDSFLPKKMSSQAILFYIFFFSFHTCMIYAHLFESNDKIPSTLKFLNQLNGIRKGNHQKGVNELKKHLSYLGYMNYLTDHANENMFDDSLESALKKYQEFHNLNTTGVLDASTISKMHKPRCGMPDIYNPNKSMSSYHIASHFQFLPGFSKWSSKNLKYAFSNNTKLKGKLPIERALKEWESVTNFRFIRAFYLKGGDIRMSFVHGDHGDGHPFFDLNTVLAHAFAPPQGEVHFNAAVNWSTNGAKESIDIQTVALHELGHALGLGHSPIQEAVMYPIINPGERKGLHKDDIGGIKALYDL